MRTAQPAPLGSSGSTWAKSLALSSTSSRRWFRVRVRHCPRSSSSGRSGWGGAPIWASSCARTRSGRRGVCRAGASPRYLWSRGSAGSPESWNSSLPSGNRSSIRLITWLTSSVLPVPPSPVTTTTRGEAAVRVKRERTLVRQRARPRGKRRNSRTISSRVSVWPVKCSLGGGSSSRSTRPGGAARRPGPGPELPAVLPEEQDEFEDGCEHCAGREGEQAPRPLLLGDELPQSREEFSDRDERAHERQEAPAPPPVAPGGGGEARIGAVRTGRGGIVHRQSGFLCRGTLLLRLSVVDGGPPSVRRNLHTVHRRLPHVGGIHGFFTAASLPGPTTTGRAGPCPARPVRPSVQVTPPCRPAAPWRSGPSPRSRPA